MASAWLWIELEHAKYSGSLSADAECDKIIKGAFALFGVDKFDDGKELLCLIASKTEANSALARMIRAHFHTPSWDFGV
jgi:hypothetical protein